LQQERDWNLVRREPSHPSVDWTTAFHQRGFPMTRNQSEATTTTAGQVGDTAPFVDDSTFGAAYERRLAEIQAVQDSELSPVNIDVASAVITVLGVMPEIKELAEQIGGLPDVDQKLFSGLDDYARAAGEANSRYVTATTPAPDIIAMNDEAMKMRETLRSD